jgi:RimJ/RimL family protein N-acetyltransferase
MVFETNRLLFRQFKLSDEASFFDMMGNPNVMNQIPLKALTKKDSNNKLREILESYTVKSEKKIWAIDLKSNLEMMGLCGFIINSENEIVYRLREKYWANGYGTEIAEGIIQFGFKKLHFDIIIGNANIHNLGSIKILEKYMFFEKEYLNKEDGFMDKRYKLHKKDWLQV